MQCAEAQLKIKAGVNSISVAIVSDKALAAHISECDLCQHYHADLMLNRTLQQFETPKLKEEFVDQLINNAILRNRPSRKLATWPRMAAMIVIGVLVSSLFRFIGVDENSPESSYPQITLVPNQVKEVRLQINSPSPRQNATISIQLAENLEIEGFTNQQRLAWQTDLSQGNNLLTLPLRLSDPSESFFDVTYTYGSVVQNIHVVVLNSATTKSNQPLI